jgi:hypothetical protein
MIEIMGRPKVERELTSPYSVEIGTIDRLQKMAIRLGYRHGESAAMGKFLGEISNINPELLALILNPDLPRLLGEKPTQRPTTEAQ